jgi:hypothetical protein
VRYLPVVAGGIIRDVIANEVPLILHKEVYATAAFVGAVTFSALDALVWTDPDFDPSLDAFYYVRVLEIPTPRWTTIQAVKLGQSSRDRARLH